MAPLTRSGLPASDTVRPLSLIRLLTAGAAGRCDRAVLSTFADALAIWSDVEVRTYTAALDGSYVLATTLPGSDAQRAPAVLPAALATLDDLRPLSTVERQELGFHIADEVVLATVGPRRYDGDAEWLIAASSSEPIDIDAALRPYLIALEHALEVLCLEQASQLTSALAEIFLAVEDPPSAAATAAAEIGRTIGGYVQLAVVTSEGAVALSSRERGAAESADDEAGLAVAVPAPAGYNATLSARGSQRPLTSGDQRRLETAASVIRAWLPRALARLQPLTPDAEPTPFERAIEQSVSEATARHDPLSLVVVDFAAGPGRGDHARRSVDRIRERIRLTDLTGRFGTGEVGVLLPATSDEGADIVRDRLRRLLDSSDPDVRIVRRSLG